MNEIFHYLKSISIWKNPVLARYEFDAWREIFGLSKDLEDFYFLFDVLPKQTKYGMKALQVKVYIQ